MATLQIIYFPPLAHISTSHPKYPEQQVYTCYSDIATLNSILQKLLNIYLCQPCIAAEENFNFDQHKGTEAKDIDTETALIIREIHERIELLQKKGLSLHTIHEALKQLQKPSRLLITSDLRIILTDYDNLEIPLTPLCKALYLLYLHHPEGIAFKHISEHRSELLTLYERTAPSINPTRRNGHIDTLIDPTKNSLNEKICLIRRAFKRRLEINLLPFYIINGEKGKTKLIEINRTLVTHPSKPSTIR